MKKWGLKVVGGIFIVVSITMILQGEIASGIFGLLLGIGFFLIPEKYNEAIYRYTWLAISLSLTFMMKLISGFFSLFTKGSEKAGKGLDNISNRAAGNKTIKCPRCKSLDVQFLDNDRKNFSVGKAVGGTALFGGVGGLAGFAGKKGKKNHWRCNECGNTFKK